jgi:predicted acyl esterase
MILRLIRSVLVVSAAALLGSVGRAADLPSKSTEMVPMRDGVKLATDIHLPAGSGPFPVILERTPYDRVKQGAKAPRFVSAGYVFVVQDWRGLFKSEGKFNIDQLTGPQGGADGFDTVEWIARQPWSNGKVGVMGTSASAIAAKQAVVANPPHLLAADTHVGSVHPGDREFLNGGVPLEQSARWVSARGQSVPEWPRPRAFASATDAVRWPRDRSAEAAAGRIAVLDHSGWYDGSCPLSFDDFLALKGPNNRLVMAAKAHGTFLNGDLKYPPQNLSGDKALDWFDHFLKGEKNKVLDTPPIRYFLMGDTMDKSAPGNVWKLADTWPAPSTPRSFYFAADGGLRDAAPTQQDAVAIYAYDPRHPAPTLGGPNLGDNNGPRDQRPLRGRKDVLHFVTEPLAAPITIIGRGSLDLYFSADVPDTTIMVKLIDIYPNGYEALTLDQAWMARFRDGFHRPSPLEPGKVYKLTIPLHDTALVFNKGHRIGVIVTGSNSPRYEVHPNSFEPVKSYDSSPVAHVTIHSAVQHPSRLVLPEVVP